jgi:LuxR family maltose regulon positive regulatory protein
LERLASAAETGGRNGRLIEILVLRALSLRASGKMELALDILIKCLVLAEPEGYIRIFLDEDEPMLKLLKRLRTKKLTPQLKDYVNRLLEASIPA